MATIDYGSTPGAPAPAVPPRPPRTSRRRGTALLLLILIGLIVYGWINVGGSISDFITGFFGSRESSARSSDRACHPRPARSARA